MKQSMKSVYCFFSLLILLLFPVILFAQGKTEFGNTMRSNGRIYVVIAVMLTILIGLVLYLTRLERKIKKLEKETTQQ